MTRPIPPKTVGLGLIHWNSGILTEQCIKTVLAGTVRPSKIVVFDNGSIDGAAASLTQRHPELVLLSSSRNLGFAHAANELISFLASEGLDYIWLLNDDTIVEPATLETLLLAMEANPSFSACSSRIVLQSDPGTVWYAGGRLDRRKVEGIHDVEARGREEGREIVPTEFISGCCMFFRFRAIGEVGLFDEAFFAYCEDTDWCFRAKVRGILLGYVPSAVIQHAVSASIRLATLGKSRGTASGFQQFLTVRSNAILIRKHAVNTSKRNLLLFLLSIRAIVLMAGQVVLGRFEKVPAVWMGVRCGCFDALDKPLRQELVERFGQPNRNLRGGT
jgi:GT2 family glycosyltransferase